MLDSLRRYEPDQVPRVCGHAALSAPGGAPLSLCCCARMVAHAGGTAQRRAGTEADARLGPCPRTPIQPCSACVTLPTARASTGYQDLPGLHAHRRGGGRRGRCGAGPDRQEPGVRGSDRDRPGGRRRPRQRRQPGRHRPTRRRGRPVRTSAAPPRRRRPRRPGSPSVASRPSATSGRCGWSWTRTWAASPSCGRRRARRTRCSRYRRPRCGASPTRPWRPSRSQPTTPRSARSVLEPAAPPPARERRGRRDRRAVHRSVVQYPGGLAARYRWTGSGGIAAITALSEVGGTLTDHGQLVSDEPDRLCRAELRVEGPLGTWTARFASVISDEPDGLLWDTQGLLLVRYGFRVYALEGRTRRPALEPRQRHAHGGPARLVPARRTSSSRARSRPWHSMAPGWSSGAGPLRRHHGRRAGGRPAGAHGVGRRHADHRPASAGQEAVG